MSILCNTEQKRNNPINGYALLLLLYLLLLGFLPCDSGTKYLYPSTYIQVLISKYLANGGRGGDRKAQKLPMSPNPLKTLLNPQSKHHFQGSSKWEILEIELCLIRVGITAPIQNPTQKVLSRCPILLNRSAYLHSNPDFDQEKSLPNSSFCWIGLGITAPIQISGRNPDSGKESIGNARPFWNHRVACGFLYPLSSKN